MTDTRGILLYDDKSDDAVFSGPTWDVTLNNMLDPLPSMKARSMTAAAADTLFFFALPEPVTTSALILNATNCDADAQVRVTAYSDAGFTIQTFTTGLVDAFPAGADLSDPDFKGLPVIVLFGEDVTAAYWQVEIVNEDNTDTYIEIGNLFLPGRTFTPTYNFAPGSSFDRDTNTKVQRAVSGTPYYSRHKNIRSWTLNYPNEDADVAWDEIDLINEMCGLDRPVFIIPFPADEARRHRQSFLGRIDKVAALQMLLIEQASTSFQITEYIG